MRKLACLALGAAAVIAASPVNGQTAATATSSAAALPRPRLDLRSVERYEVDGRKFVRFNYRLLNKADYPAALFARAAGLPPCGKNPDASRTWIDFHNAATGARLFGFCTIMTPVGLDRLWFALPEGTAAPRAVYITITDRQTGARARSNNAATSPDARVPSGGHPID